MLLIVITYIPYLVQWQLDILVYRDISLLSTGTLAFSWIGRCLMQLNCSVNPFVYAVILPAFRRFVATKMSMFRSKQKQEEMSVTFRRQMALTQVASQSDTGF